MAKTKPSTLKNILKTIKLNESTISMVLGAIVLIIVGSYLIGYLKNSKGSIPEELLSGTNSTEETINTYTVKKGDNLWNIAVSYYGDGFKWVEIATENKLPNAGVIEEGQKLTIPDLKAITLENQENPITTDKYEVQKGDSLWSIAVRTYGDGYQWTRIANENNLSHPSLIHIGNVLTIPR